MQNVHLRVFPSNFLVVTLLCPITLSTSVGNVFRLKQNLKATEKTNKNINEPGVEAAKTGASIAGGVSAAQNIASVIRGEKEVGAAIIDTAIDIAKGAAYCYGVSATSSLVSGGLKQLNNRVASQGAKSLFESLSKGNAPALIVTSTIEIGKSINRYLNGELNGEELVIELGEKRTAIAVSTITASVGAELGAIAGGIIGTFIVPGAGTADYNAPIG